jgi:hypothetical protein
MYINISDSKEAANKGSSSGLVHYLEKENRLDKLKAPEYWFNGQAINIDPYDVMRTIDNNVAKLSKADAKFFLINISPSQKEIAFLRAQYGDDGVKEQLKGFAVRVMLMRRTLNGKALAATKTWYGSLSWKTIGITALTTLK